MSDKPHEWLNRSNFSPEHSGWYPVLVCWDPDEGCFPSAAEWTGTEWRHPDGSPVTDYWPMRFDYQVYAAKFADEHDPGW